MTRTQEVAYALVEEFFNRISVPANKMQSEMNYEAQRNMALWYIQDALDHTNMLIERETDALRNNPHKLAWYAINKTISTDPYTYLECLYVDAHSKFSHNCEIEHPLPQDSSDGGRIDEH